MVDASVSEWFDRYQAVFVAGALYASLVVVAVLAGESLSEAARHLLLPTVLVGWSASVLSAVEGPSLRAVGGVLLLVGGVGEGALFFLEGPAARMLAVELIIVAGILGTLLGRRR